MKTRERNTTSVTMTIDKELHQRVTKYAKQEERSISFVVKKALIMYLDNKENKD